MKRLDIAYELPVPSAGGGSLWPVVLLVAAVVVLAVVLLLVLRRRKPGKGAQAAPAREAEAKRETKPHD